MAKFMNPFRRPRSDEDNSVEITKQQDALKDQIKKMREEMQVAKNELIAEMQKWKDHRNA